MHILLFDILFSEICLIIEYCLNSPHCHLSLRLIHKLSIQTGVLSQGCASYMAAVT